MGTWGSGNFESDHARDFLAEHIKNLVEFVDKLMQSDETFAQGRFLEDYGDTQIMTTLEIIIVLCEQLNAGPHLEPEVCEAWKTKYLQAYDQQSIAYPSKFAAERRRVIENTFDALKQLID